MQWRRMQIESGGGGVTLIKKILTSQKKGVTLQTRAQSPPPPVPTPMICDNLQGGKTFNSKFSKIQCILIIHSLSKSEYFVTSQAKKNKDPSPKSLFSSDWASSPASLFISKMQTFERFLKKKLIRQYFLKNNLLMNSIFKK